MTTCKTEFTELKEVTTIERRPVEIINGKLSNCAYISVLPQDSGRTVDIVIGANRYHRCASNFTKAEIGELIAVLEDIRDALKDR